MRASSNGAKSAQSIQSSLLSEVLLLPDETVYSRYDDVIVNIDNDVETAVGSNGGFKGSTVSGVSCHVALYVLKTELSVNDMFIQKRNIEP